MWRGLRLGQRWPGILIPWAGHDFLGWCLLLKEKRRRRSTTSNKGPCREIPDMCPGTLQPGAVRWLCRETHRSDPTVVNRLCGCARVRPCPLQPWCVLASQGISTGAIEQYEDALRLKPDSIDAPGVSPIIFGHRTAGRSSRIARGQHELGLKRRSDASAGRGFRGLRRRPVADSAPRSGPGGMAPKANGGLGPRPHERLPRKMVWLRHSALEHYKQAVLLAPDSG